MTQPTLYFDGASPETLATSRAAAEAIAPDAATLRECLYIAIANARHGLTDREAQDALGMPGDTQRPRRRELEKAGRIRKAGERLTASNRRSVVWAAVNP